MNIPMKVCGVFADPNTEAHVIILKDTGETDVLPIWVGTTESNAIRFALEGILPKRPQTHDLLKDILQRLEIQIEKVVITDIHDNVYYAELSLRQKWSEQSAPEPEEWVVDARPSDAIALALWMNAPIYTSEEVFSKKGGDDLNRWLEQLKPSDFNPSV